MTDLVLNHMTNGNNISVANNNFDKIEEAVNDRTIQNSGGKNTMFQQLDMNGNRIINVSTDQNNPNSLLTVAGGDTRYYQQHAVPNPSLPGDAVNKATLDLYNLPQGFFTQTGTGAINRSWNGKVGETVSVTDFGADPSGVADSTAAIQNAINAALRVNFPPGTYKITGPVALRSGGKLQGASATATIISCQGTTAGFTLVAPVGIGTAVQGCDISDMLIDGPSANTGLVLTSTFRIRLSRVTFRGFAQAQMACTQVWDSWFEDCYWRNNNVGNTTAAITVFNGSADNSNNLRFTSCHWETLQAGCFNSQNQAATTSTNYNFFFNGCKSEGCNLAQIASAFYVFGGINATPGVTFKKHMATFLAAETTNTTFITGAGVGNLGVEDVYMTFKVPYVPPLISMSNGRGVYLKNISIQDTAGGSPALTSYFFHDLGGTINFYAENLLYNNTTLANGADTSISSSADYAPRYHRIFGTEGLRVERTNTAQNGYWQINLNTDGTVSENLTLSTTSTPNTATRSSSRSIFTSGVNGATLFSQNGSIRAEGGAWNSGKYLLGSQRIWADATNQLRIKAGDPASDTDGVLVGRAGTTTNDNAQTGSIGEYQTASGSGTSLTSNTFANLTSISLTAGDWDVQGFMSFIPAGTTTVSNIQGSISLTSGVTGAAGNGTVLSLGFGTGSNQQISTPTVRVSLAATTTVYLVAASVFGVSTMTANSVIRARRVR